jgi:ATP-dependent Clp protease protease subunit
MVYKYKVLKIGGTVFKLLVLIMSLTMSGFGLAKNHKPPTKMKEVILTDDNVISLRSAFSAESVSQVIEEATKLNSRLPSGHPIYLFLRTPGGSIQAGLELFEFLKGLNRPVHTVTLFAASMGFQTVQQLGKRYILKYGVLMSHPASGQINGQFSNGRDQMDSRYGLWLRRIAILDQDTVKRTNGKQTLESYRNSYASELWLNGEEAVNQGYADEVVTVKCDSSLEGKTETITESALFLSIDIKMPKCPLLLKPVDTKANIATNLGMMPLGDFLKHNPSFKTCAQKEEENKGSFNSSESPVICAIDPDLNIVKIKEAMTNAAKIFTEDLRNKIILTP